MKLREELSQWQKRATDAEDEAKKLRADLTSLQAELATLSQQVKDNPESKTLRTELDNLKAEAKATADKLTETTERLADAQKTLTAMQANPPPKTAGADPGSQKPKEPNETPTRKRNVRFV